MKLPTLDSAPVFLSTLSLRRATARAALGSGLIGNFYPRSPCGERPGQLRQKYQQYRFLSTLSLRRATDLTGYNEPQEEISIHALLAESDGINFDRKVSLVGISIHALLAESDHTVVVLPMFRVEFLSTLSLRRATANQTDLLGKN